MKHKLIFLMALVLVLVSFSGCSIFLNIFKTNEPPTVTLSATYTNIFSGVPTQITANADDEDGDSLTYEWYVDDVIQDNITTSVFSFGMWVMSSQTYSISCIVSDGEESTEASISIYVDGDTYDAALTVVNNSSYTIDILYVSLSTSGDWGTNILIGVIMPGGTVTLNNIPPNEYDFKVYAGALQSMVFNNFLYSNMISTWTLNNSSFY